jgi:membrane protease YdiL (CAAX protease family)
LTARSIFIGAEDRLRPPWRILLFLALGASCIIVVMIGLGPVLQSVEQLVGIQGTGAAYGTATALLLAHWMTLRTFDQRTWQFVGLHSEGARPRVLLFGWALGATPIAIACLFLLAVGWLAIGPASPGSSFTAAARISLILIPAALYEELLARGYVFATLGEWLGRPIAVALTSIAFGLMHVPNPSADPLPIVIVVLAGVYLAAVLMATQSLYAVWMAHWAWNSVMAVGLHIPVSGLPFARPDYQTVDAGPDWVTGGPWGPEGGVAAAAAMLGGLGYLYWRARRLGDRPKVDSAEPSTLQR